MRDVIILLIVLGVLPMVLARPHIGIYLWSWISYMNPHRLAWGFASTFPFAFLTAIATLIGFLFSKEPKRLPWTREATLLTIFVVWMFITTLTAFNSDSAWDHWNKIWKIQMMTLVTLTLMLKKERIEGLIWVMAGSLAFYGVKGGIFTILTGGNYRVWGPPGTFIGGNNEIALALVMVIPLLRYLQITVTKRWQSVGLGLTMILCMISIIGTYSRGAFLALAAMGLLLVWKSRKRASLLLALTIVLPLAALIVPAKWTERMQTIETYEEDASVQGRFNSWIFAFNLAKDHPLVGGGFEAFTPKLFEMYAPDPEDVHDAHSIYFEVLGEQGFVGLGLFLLLGWFTWRSCVWIAKQAKDDPDTQWMADLARMLQVSIVGYAVGGTFLGLAYFDFYYHLIAVVILLKVLLQDHLKQRAAMTVPDRPLSPAVGRLGSR